MGGLFLCALDRENNLKMNKRTNGELSLEVEFVQIFKYLRKFFSQTQRELIEFIYENGNGAVSTGLDSIIQIDSKLASTASQFMPDNWEDVGLSDRFRLIVETL